MNELDAVLVRDVTTGDIVTVCRACVGPSEIVEGCNPSPPAVPTRTYRCPRCGEALQRANMEDGDENE